MTIFFLSTFGMRLKSQSFPAAFFSTQMAVFSPHQRGFLLARMTNNAVSILPGHPCVGRCRGNQQRAANVRKCATSNDLAKPYRCLGLMVLRAGNFKDKSRIEVDVMNCKMWKVDMLPQDGHWPGKPYGQ